MSDTNQHSEPTEREYLEGLRYEDKFPDTSRDYLERTIETVRIHRTSGNSWPQWANIFADEIERLWGIEEQLEAAQERLAAYEEPGYINSVQAVVEARRRAARLEEQLEALEGRVQAALLELGRASDVRANRTGIIGNVDLILRGSNPASTPEVSS